MTTSRILAASLMFALMAPAFARDNGGLPVAASKEHFEALKAQLTSALETTRFGDIKPDDKQAVLKALDRIETRYNKVVKSDQMSDDDRVDMFNDQEIINTIITRAAADSRMICERTVSAGTHMMRVSCMTLAVRKERAKTGQDAMNGVLHDGNNTFPGATTMRQGITR
jgi:hypothetical protein